MNATEIRNAVLIVLATFGILVLAKPKSKIKSKYEKPKEANSKDNEFENAIVAIKAYREAVKDGATTATLNELNRELIKEYDIRVIDKNGQLVATNRNGTAIANEEAKK